MQCVVHLLGSRPPSSQLDPTMHALSTTMLMRSQQTRPRTQGNAQAPQRRHPPGSQPNLPRMSRAPFRFQCSQRMWLRTRAMRCAPLGPRPPRSQLDHTLHEPSTSGFLCSPQSRLRTHAVCSAPAGPAPSQLTAGSHSAYAKHHGEHSRWVIARAHFVFPIVHYL